MSGMGQIIGQSAPKYQRSGRNPTDENEWPPKYWKACLTFSGLAAKSGHFPQAEGGEEEGVAGEWAFADPRRLGRIKLVEGVPEETPPLSLLGECGEYRTADRAENWI